MNPRQVHNVAASIRQRLLNKARADNRPFGELLQYYAMERFLYRLSKSSHADRFVLKGAMMLRVWRSPQSRPTMDIDMLGRIPNEEADVTACILDVLSVDVEPDGLIFDPSTIQTARIAEDADYHGIRIAFLGTLDSARIRMRVDIGFGDVVVPGPEMSLLPAVLDSPAPALLCYSRESTIAEKFEAMLKLRQMNSRMKDFYDIWLLSRQFDFEAEKLAQAIMRTLENRGTDLPDEIAAFSEDFSSAKQVQWMAFRRRLSQEQLPKDFSQIVAGLSAFLSPIVDALRSGTEPSGRWVAPGPWILTE